MQVVDADADADGLIRTVAMEREVTFFAKAKFPSACIGPVTLLVVPALGDGVQTTDSVKVCKYISTM